MVLTLALLFENQLTFLVVIFILATTPVFTTLDKGRIRYRASMYAMQVLPFPYSSACLQPLGDYCGCLRKEGFDREVGLYFVVLFSMCECTMEGSMIVGCKDDGLFLRRNLSKLAELACSGLMAAALVPACNCPSTRGRTLKGTEYH